MKKKYIYIILIVAFAPIAQSATVVLNTTDDAYIVDGTPNDALNNELLIIKRERGGGSTANRKAWFKFDLTGLTETSAALTLTIGEQAAANAGVFPSTYSFNLYALNSSFVPGVGELGSDWTESTISWNNAPGHNQSKSGVDTTEMTFLDSFSLAYSTIAGKETTINIENLDLLKQADNSITFALMTTSEGDGNFKFASSENTTHSGPTLTFTNVPEPSSVTFLGLASLILLRRDRKA